MKTCSRCERKIYKPGFRYCAFCQAAIKKKKKNPDKKLKN
jgi:hypothetical protein